MFDHWGHPGCSLHQRLLRCWCSDRPLEGRSDPQVCEWVKRYKNGKRKINGNGKKLRIFCCYSLTGSKFYTFKWRLKFDPKWLLMPDFLEINWPGRRKRAAWVLIFPLLSHEDTIIHTFPWLVADQRSVCVKPSPRLWVLETSEPVYSTGWAWMFELRANKEPRIPSGFPKDFLRILA